MLRATRESVRAHRGEHVICVAQLIARVGTAVGAA
jgi:hypothetical protein